MSDQSETPDLDSPDDVELQSESQGRLDVEVHSGHDEEADSFTEIPPVLPVLPLKNTVLFPFLLSPLLVNTPRSQKLIDDVLLRSDRLMVCTAVTGEIDGSPGAGDVYRYGTVLRVVRMLKFRDGSYRLLVQGIARVHIDEFESEEPFLSARVHPLEDHLELESVEATALVRTVSQQFAALVSESARLSDELQVLAVNMEDPSHLADLVASNLDLPVEGKQAVLEEADVVERLKIVLAQLSKEGEVLQIEAEIKEKVQSEMGRTQRDYMLRQQLDAIRQELGESRRLR